jgi:threonyl-tRNA synthetase
LAPVQAIGIAVAEEYEEYLSGVLDLLKAEGLRVQLDASDDRMQKKIRNAAAQKIPMQIIAGEEDRANGAVSFRFRDGSQRNGIPVAEAVALLVAAVKDHRQILSSEDL